MPYTEYDSTKPDGADDPAPYSADDLSNQRALRDMVIMGRVPGYVQSRTQGTGPSVERSQYFTWYKSSTTSGFRMNITWSGYQMQSVAWEYTTDGTNWNALSTQANTYDASNNITTTTVAGGFVTLVMELMTKCFKAIADQASHIAATGTSVHGLGDVATQTKSNVDFTGGLADVTLGSRTPKNVDSTRVRETFHDYGSPGASVTLELDKYGHFAVTLPATQTDTFSISVSGAPAAGISEVWTLELINAKRSADGKITYPAATKWLQGSSARPHDDTLELSGRNLFVFQTRDGASRLEFQHIGKGG